MNIESLLSQEPETTRHAAGDVVFDKDDPGDAMFVVRSGAIDLMVDGKVLERVGPGGIFGEMALLDRAERSATAIACEPIDVIRISRDRFQELIRREPRFALHVMGVLADRLRRMNTLG